MMTMLCNNKLSGYPRKKLNEQVNKFEMVMLLLLLFLIAIWMISYININFYFIMKKINIIIIFPLLLIIFFLLIIEKKIKKKECIILLFFNIVLFFNLIITKSSLGSIVNIETYFLIFLISRKIYFKKENIFSIVLIFNIYNIFWLSSNYYLYNSNTIGIIGMILIFMNSIFITQCKFKSLNFFVFLLILKNLEIILSADSRGALGGVLLFLVLLISGNKLILKNKYFFNILIFFETIGSLIFVYLYVYLWCHLENNFFILGKRIFTGREKIWYELFTLFKNKIFVGLGSGLTLKSFVEYNVHNSMYSLLIVYGIGIYIYVIGLIIYNLNINYEVIKKNKLSKISFFIASGLFISSFVETTLINMSHYCIILLVFIIINSGRRRGKNDRYLSSWRF